MIQKERLRYIEHPFLPEDIWLAVEVRQTGPSGIGTAGKSRAEERRGGRRLIGRMVADRMGEAAFRITGEENCKPHGVYAGNKVEISISHCSTLYCGVVSAVRRVGVDLEPVHRQVHPGLARRIMHPAESQSEELSAIQLWTLKEAALKWIGSGLRLPMRSIAVNPVGPQRFSAMLPAGGPLEICSFCWNKYWISIAFAAETG